MKIYCDKCGKDITETVSSTFEGNKVGNITCPHCNAKQKRYISETDLLVYLAYQEIIYFILSFITSQIFLYYKITIPLIVLFIIVFVLMVLTTKIFKCNIYSKGYLKKEKMYISKIEDQDKVARSIRWQFLMFFALVITFFTTTTAYWFFVAMSIVAIAITIIKAILSAKKE